MIHTEQGLSHLAIRKDKTILVWKGREFTCININCTMQFSLCTRDESLAFFLFVAFFCVCVCVCVCISKEVTIKFCVFLFDCSLLWKNLVAA